MHHCTVIPRNFHKRMCRLQFSFTTPILNSVIQKQLLMGLRSSSQTSHTCPPTSHPLNSNVPSAFKGSDDIGLIFFMTKDTYALGTMNKYKPFAPHTHIIPHITHKTQMDHTLNLLASEAVIFKFVPKH